MVHAPLYLFIVNATVNARVVSQNPQIYFKMITSNIMYLNVYTKMHKSCCSKYSAIVHSIPPTMLIIFDETTIFKKNIS